MMRSRPDHRYQAVLKAVTTEDVAPSDGLSAALFAHLTDAPAPEDVISAYDIYREEEHRAIVDAFMLVKSSSAEISTLLDIPVSVLETYAHLFMDVSVFRNRLETISYASNYDSSPHGKELIKTAVMVGADYLYWAYGKPRADFDARAVINRTMTDAYFRGMAHKGNSLTSGVAKEAHKWWQMAIKNAETTERLNPSTAKQAIEELRIALGQNDETRTPDEFEVPITEIMH